MIICAVTLEVQDKTFNLSCYDSNQHISYLAMTCLFFIVTCNYVDNLGFCVIGYGKIKKLRKGKWLTTIFLLVWMM